MLRHAPRFCLFLITLLAAPVSAQDHKTVANETPTFTAVDWPWWRGERRDGIAAAHQSPPTQWGEGENIVWRAEIPGRGHGSPTLLGNRVFLATADPGDQTQRVLCFDRDSGERLWNRVVHQGGFKNKSKRKPNLKASLASSSLATDGERLFINFLNDNAVHTSSLDLDGHPIWQREVSPYVVHQGYGSSPAVYRHLVIVSADNKLGGAIMALDRATGEIVWRRDRPEKPNYSSPTIVRAGGKDQLIMTGCDLVTSLNPLTGDVLWEIEGATTECVTTTPTDGTHIFTSGGYPKNHIAAVVADGSGSIAWEANLRAYVPSLIQRDGYLYATLDAGIATCLNSSTGDVVWKARLSGTFSSSPVMVGDTIYASNEEGETHVFRATPDGFEPIAMNQLGESVYATPVISDSRIYTRVAHREDDQRREYLYCIGE